MDREQLKHDIVVGLVVALIMAALGGLGWPIFPDKREWWFQLFASVGFAIAAGWSWLWGGVAIPRIVVGVAIILALAFIGSGGRLEALVERLMAFQRELHRRSLDLLSDHPVS